MTRGDAIAKLKPIEGRLRDLGATAMFLFGSTARGEAKETSDLDVFLDNDSASRFSLLDVLTAQYVIEDELKIAIDVLTRTSLHARLKPEAERDAVRVFRW